MGIIEGRQELAINKCNSIWQRNMQKKDNTDLLGGKQEVWRKGETNSAAAAQSFLLVLMKACLGSTNYAYKCLIINWGAWSFIC